MYMVVRTTCSWRVDVSWYARICVRSVCIHVCEVGMHAYIWSGAQNERERERERERDRRFGDTRHIHGQAIGKSSPGAAAAGAEGAAAVACAVCMYVCMYMYAFMQVQMYVCICAKARAVGVYVCVVCMHVKWCSKYERDRERETGG
jgi:hypothetical protein